MIKPEELKEQLATALQAGDVWRAAHLRTLSVKTFAQVNKPATPKNTILDYQEMCRRAERTVGLLIRKGQAEGTIRGQGQSKSDLPAPGTFLGSGKANVEIYDMTDGTDERFEAALATGRSEGTLSRAHMIRLLGPRRSRAWISDVGDVAEDWVPEASDHRAQASHQRRRLIAAWAEEGLTSAMMQDRMGTGATTIRRISREHSIRIPADEISHRARTFVSDQIVSETAASMEGLAMTAGLVKTAELDRAQLPGWLASLRSSHRTLGQLIKELAAITTEETAE
jgi:hypothetical protein